MKYLLWITLPLYALDQWTKWLIVQNFQLGDFRPVIPGFFNLVRVHNTGMAFGTGNGGNIQPHFHHYRHSGDGGHHVHLATWRLSVGHAKVAAALLVSGIAAM
ncbi:MAG: signal peptidase II [Verrucomicrobiales bacterium]